MLGCRPAAYLNVYGVREASCQWNSCIEILPHHKLRCICMCKTKKHFIFFFSVRGTTKSFYSIILFKYTCTHRHLLTHTPINTQTHTYRHQSGQVTSAWFLLQRTAAGCSFTVDFVNPVLSRLSFLEVFSVWFIDSKAWEQQGIQGYWHDVE